LQDFIKKIEKKGFATYASGDSLAVEKL